MKKALMLIIALCLCVFLGTTAFAEDELTVRDYVFERYGTTYYFLAVTNNTDSTVRVEGQCVAKNADGKNIGAEDMYINALGPGETALGDFMFFNLTGIAEFNYELVCGEPYYECVTKDIEFEHHANKNNVIVSATNKGELPADTVIASVLFFDKDGNVVGYDYNYISDAEYELKPERTIYTEIDAPNAFDSYEIFTSAMAYSERPTKTSYSGDDVEVTGFIHESWGMQSGYFIVRNNADTALQLTINYLAVDEKGNWLSAGDASIYVIGSGDTSVADCWFDTDGEIYDVLYEVSVTDEIIYYPMLSFLKQEYSDNGNNIVVTLTNCSGQPMDSVYGYAIFFDADDNVISCTQEYFGDSDYQIKPGKSAVKQMNSDREFDRFLVYYTLGCYEQAELAEEFENELSFTIEDFPGYVPAPVDTTGFDPDFVADVQAYEAFVDKFIEIFNKVSENPEDEKLVSELEAVSDEWEAIEEAFLKWMDADLSEAEAKYYVDTATRCSEKMLAVL